MEIDVIDIELPSSVPFLFTFPSSQKAPHVEWSQWKDYSSRLPFLRNIVRYLSFDSALETLKLVISSERRLTVIMEVFSSFNILFPSADSFSFSVCFSFECLCKMFSSLVSTQDIDISSVLKMVTALRQLRKQKRGFCNILFHGLFRV